MGQKKKSRTIQPPSLVSFEVVGHEIQVGLKVIRPYCTVQCFSTHYPLSPPLGVFLNTFSYSSPFEMFIPEVCLYIFSYMMAFWRATHREYLGFFTFPWKSNVHLLRNITFMTVHTPVCLLSHSRSSRGLGPILFVISASESSTLFRVFSW